MFKNAIRIVGWASLLFVLAGCAELGRPPAVKIPSPGDITGYGDKISAQITNPQKYTADGYVYVRKECTQFLNALADAENNAQFVRNETVAGLATTSAVLAIARNTAQTLAYVAAGTAFATQTFDNWDNWAYLTRYQSALRRIVTSALDQYEQQLPPSRASDATSADKLVSGFASLCTTGQMIDFIQESLNQLQPAAQLSYGNAVKDIVAQQIKTDLGLGDPATDEQMKALLAALSASDDGTRVAAKLAGSRNPYWDAKGRLTGPGVTMRVLLTSLFPTPAPVAVVVPDKSAIAAQVQADLGLSAPASDDQMKALLTALTGTDAARKAATLPGTKNPYWDTSGKISTAGTAMRTTLQALYPPAAATQQKFLELAFPLRTPLLTPETPTVLPSIHFDMVPRTDRR